MPNVAVVSSAPRQTPTDHSEIIGSAVNAAFPTSQADIPASSARNRILMEATAVARALVEVVAEEVDVEAEVVAVEEAAVSEEVAEAVETGVFQEEMIHRKVIRKSLLTSRAL